MSFRCAYTDIDYDTKTDHEKYCGACQFDFRKRNEPKREQHTKAHKHQEPCPHGDFRFQVQEAIERTRRETIEAVIKEIDAIVSDCINHGECIEGFTVGYHLKQLKSRIKEIKV